MSFSGLWPIFEYVEDCNVCWNHTCSAELLKSLTEKQMPRNTLYNKTQIHLTELQGWICGVQDNKKFKDFLSYLHLLLLSQYMLQIFFKKIFWRMTAFPRKWLPWAQTWQTCLVPSSAGNVAQSIAWAPWIPAACFACRNRGKTWPISATTQISTKIITVE